MSIPIIRWSILIIIIHFVLLCLLFYIDVISYPYTSNTSHSFNAIFGACLVMIILSISWKTHGVIFILVSLALSCYFSFISYFSHFYGRFIDLGSFASIIESTYGESIEFIGQLGFISFFISVSVSILFLFICFSINIFNVYKRINIPALIFIFLIMITVKVIYAYEEDNSIKELITKSFSKHFAFDTALIFKDYIVHLTYMSEQINPLWNNVNYIEEAIDIYVVVLGESVIKKHMTLYGYERDTTFTLDEIRGITLVMDPIAAAIQTRLSVPRMLALNNSDGVEYDMNIIDLANMAGFETYWISNQGFIGRHDTPVTKIARRADHSIYLNKGEFSRSGYDYLLLEPLKSALLGGNKKKLIFVHLLGSHPEFCSRSWKRFYAESQKYNHVINCYDDSIKNTTLLLLELIAELRHYRAKLLYTADHGFKEISEPPYIVHGVGKYFGISAFEVPLFTWDSRISYNRVIDETYYMRNFTHTLADFLHIESDNVDYRKSILSDEYERYKPGEYVIKSSGEMATFN